MNKTGWKHRLNIGLRRHWKIFPVWMLHVFGVVWAIIEPLSFFLPNSKAVFDIYSPCILLGSVIAAIIYALCRCMEPLEAEIPIKGTNTSIRIMYGDFFKIKSHLAVPVNEFFDSQLGSGNSQHGDIVAPNSIHGQFITKTYNSDSARFDTDVQSALSGVTNLQVQRTGGKNLQYPIGTTAAIGVGAHKNFLFALTRTDLSSAKASADMPTMWNALLGLWEKVRQHSNGLPVAIPLVGSGQSHVGLEPMHLLRLIILSVLKASQQQEITKEIQIILLDDYFDKIDLRLLKKEWA